MTWRDPHNETSPIIRFDGRPKATGEAPLWRRFLKWIRPLVRRGGTWAACGGELAQEYACAEIASKKAEAQKRGAEAAEIAARADQESQKVVRDFSEVVDNILPEDSEAATALKLAKLIEQNPALAGQIDKVASIMEKLKLRGASIQIVPGESKEAPSATVESQGVLIVATRDPEPPVSKGPIERS